MLGAEDSWLHPLGAPGMVPSSAMVLEQEMLNQPGSMQAAETINQSLMIALVLPRICVQLGAKPDQHRPILC